MSGISGLHIPHPLPRWVGSLVSGSGAKTAKTVGDGEKEGEGPLPEEMPHSERKRGREMDEQMKTGQPVVSTDFRPRREDTQPRLPPVVPVGPQHPCSSWALEVLKGMMGPQHAAAPPPRPAGRVRLQGCAGQRPWGGETSPRWPVLLHGGPSSSRTLPFVLDLVFLVFSLEPPHRLVCLTPS